MKRSFSLARRPSTRSRETPLTTRAYVAKLPAREPESGSYFAGTGVIVMGGDVDPVGTELRGFRLAPPG
jgi:hypothetical protein